MPGLGVWRSGKIIRSGNLIAIALLALHFFVLPGLISIYFLCDSNLRQPGIPKFAWWAHKRLTGKYERWAAARVARNEAVADVDDISGTEWPLFGSVFYLAATESLQEAWEQGDRRSSVAPAVYARGAIEAAAALVTDPGQAAWVKKHWGQDYLHTENAFFRMMLISAMTSHEKLLKNGRYLPMLRDQVETFSAELDRSPMGLLNDYPGECYPLDVLAAIAAVHRANLLLGNDDSEFIQRARRGFEGPCLDPETGLPPFGAFPDTGEPIGGSRGIGNSYMALNAPDLWPDTAAQWYSEYERQFWQYRWTACGFREFPKGMAGGEWYMDVDSGPVIAGHGTAACAFAVGGARRNGRFDHAWPLSAEMIVTCWPLANGTLVGPRILSNVTDAPYLGEAGILYLITRQPTPGTEIRQGGSLPLYVFILLVIYLGMGALFLFLAYRRFGQLRKQPPVEPPLARLQFALWICLMAAGIYFNAGGHWIPGMALFLSAQLLPRGRKKVPGGQSA